jgi:glycosyltransferase involved in cell wall biosynthesis
MKKFRGIQKNQGYSITYYENLNCSEKPEVSVIMPVFQQEKIIYRNLNSIYKSMSMYWELILIEDAGKDKTKNEILRWINDLSPMGNRLLKIILIKNIKELYETKCDILGFKNAESKYLIEIQSDMEITEVAFDRKLVEALESHPDIFMISGRGTHSFDEAFKELILISRRFTEVKFIFKQIFVWLIKDSKFEHRIKLLLKSKSIDSKEEEFASEEKYHESSITPNLGNFISTKGKAGRLGHLITTEYSSTQIQARNIWLGETVMRGPLIIRRNLYEQLGGFDSSCFYLGFDDHDLSLRGYKYFNLRTGFVPVGFKSPPQDSTTKRKKNLIGLFKYLLIGHNFYAKSNKSELYQMGKNLKPIAPQLEIRDF